MTIGPGPFDEVAHRSIHLVEERPCTLANRTGLRTRVVLAPWIDVLVVNVHQPIWCLEDREQQRDVTIGFEKRLQRPALAVKVARQPLGNVGGLPVLVVVDLDVDLVVPHGVRDPLGHRLGIRVVLWGLSPALRREHPGHRPAIDDRRGKGHRDVEQSDAGVLRVRRVPDGRSLDAIQPYQAVVALHVAEGEPEDAVLTGIDAGEDRRPTGRRVGRNRRGEHPGSSALEQSLQLGHVSGLERGIQYRERDAIESQHERFPHAVTALTRMRAIPITTKTIPTHKAGTTQDVRGPIT